MGSILGYLLFFLGGLGFGYAAPGRLKFVPFVFPILLALGAAARDGLRGPIFIKLLIALVITAIGIVLGWMLDERSRKAEAAEAH
jgi:hypothetical protein